MTTEREIILVFALTMEILLGFDAFLCSRGITSSLATLYWTGRTGGISESNLISKFGYICIFKTAWKSFMFFVFFLKSSALQKKVRHQMSSRTVLLIKQSRIFTQTSPAANDGAELTYSISTYRKKQFSIFWLSSHICFTKEYFRPSDSGTLYTPWLLI